MKKLILIAVVLFGVTTAQAQTQTKDVIDTLETSSKFARGKVVLPNDIANNMVIERSVINNVVVLLVQFDKKLTETEIELVKTYIGYYYEKSQPNGKKYNTSAPDINNTKNKCVMKFYKL